MYCMIGIVGGQRDILLRMNEGPLFFASFANAPGLNVTDKCGNVRVVTGLYAAISLDEGNTWKHRLIRYGMVWYGMVWYGVV